MRKLILFTLLATLCVAPVWAQGPKELTNDDVVTMVKGGLSETAIVLAVQRGPARFDTTPAALVSLKEQGVPARVIEAMLGGGKEAAAPAPKGAFYKVDGAKWARIEQITSLEVRAVGQFASLLTNGIKEMRMVCVFRGARAQAQFNERRPVFRVSGLGVSAGDIYIISLRKNPERRDVEVGRSGLLKKASSGFRKRDIHDVEVKRLGDDLLEITPKNDLAPGEYLLFTGNLNAGGAQLLGRRAVPGVSSVSGFDFGIAGK
jgi:hypothetical protein